MQWQLCEAAIDRSAPSSFESTQCTPALRFQHPYSPMQHQVGGWATNTTLSVTVQCNSNTQGTVQACTRASQLPHDHGSTPYTIRLQPALSTVQHAPPHSGHDVTNQAITESWQLLTSFCCWISNRTNRSGCCSPSELATSKANAGTCMPCSHGSTLGKSGL